jgi:hypothetical protein
MQHPNDLGRLKKGREKYPVIVRVIRKWTVKETVGQYAPLYVGMVLADAKVTKTYTSYNVRAFTFFADDLSYIP